MSGADYRDEWGRDGFGDGSSPVPSDGGPGSPGVDSYLPDGNDPAYDHDDEPMTDSEGNPIEQVVAPGSGAGLVHAYPPPHSGAGTPCCGRFPSELPDGDTLTRDPDAVTCREVARIESGEYDEADADAREFARRDPDSATPPPDREPTADEIGEGMLTYARAIRDESREHAGHTDAEPRLDPETGDVVCGCGETVDEGPDGSGYEPVTPPTNLPSATTSAADPVMSDHPFPNPRAHYTPAEIERAILEQARRLDAGLALEAQWIEQRHTLQREFDKAAHRARLTVQGGAKDVRDARVYVKCEAEADALADAVMRCEVIKASMHSLRSVLSGLQSVGRSLGVLAQAGGGDGQAPYRNRQGQQ